MTRKYTVQSKYRRWSLQVFFNILYLAKFNARVLYEEFRGKNFYFNEEKNLPPNIEKMKAKATRLTKFVESVICEKSGENE